MDDLMTFLLSLKYFHIRHQPEYLIGTKETSRQLVKFFIKKVELKTVLSLTFPEIFHPENYCILIPHSYFTTLKNIHSNLNTHNSTLVMVLSIVYLNTFDIRHIPCLLSYIVSKLSILHATSATNQVSIFKIYKQPESVWVQIVPSSKYYLKF